MDVTILNGKKHMKHSRQARRLARHNPEGGLAKAAGSAALATAVAVPIAIVLDRAISGMKKGGTGADAAAPKYTQNQVALLELAAAAVIGVGLHVKDTAPTVGVAVLAAGGAIAGKRWYDARPAASTTTSTTPASPDPRIAAGADFSLTITPASATVTLGSGDQFRDYAVAVVKRDPAATITPVRLVVTGLTQGVTALVEPESITSATPGRIRLTVPPTGASASTVNITVAGTNASGTASVTASLVIAAAATADATPPARLPFGMLRRAGAAYDMTYGQVSRSGEAVGPQQPTVYRSNVVPVMATESQIQGQDVIGSMGPMGAGGDKVPTSSSIERFINTDFEESRQRVEEEVRRAMPAMPPPPREGIARNPFANGCQCPPPPSIHNRRIYGAEHA